LKKIILTLMLLVVPIITIASDNTSFMVGNKAYDNLNDAIKNANSNETIKMYSNANLEDSITIDKKVNINLNGNNITAPTTVFFVDGGNLNITGKGVIKELEPNYGAIRIMGKNTDTDLPYSTVNISKDVTLEGWTGINVSHTNYKSHGVSITMDGTINAISDINGDSGIGIYVNGNIQHEESHPKIEITDNAKIYSNGTGLYIAGYSTFNIKDAYIEGIESGLSIKSGKLNIDGATIVCTGKDTTPTEGYNNGVNSSGTAIQIESNNGYAGNIELDIKSGTIKSKNSSVIYEYIGKGDNTQVKSISISGGNFVSEVDKKVFLLSNDFKSTHPSFISGGTYSSNPSDYLKTGYSASKENNKYTVSKSAMAVFGEKIDNSNSFNNVVIFIVLIFIAVILFINRFKIIKYFKKTFNLG